MPKNTKPNTGYDYSEAHPQDLQRIAERAKQQAYGEDSPLILEMLGSFFLFTSKLCEQGITIAKLKRIFGAKTERLKNRSKSGAPAESSAEASPGQQATEDGAGAQGAEGRASDAKPDKEPGHGRRPADAYVGAKIIEIAHQTLEAGENCPDCQKGRLYSLLPGRILRIVGQPWLKAQVYAPERLRCSLCGKVFTALVPSEVATQGRADKTAKAIVSILKYRGGCPFYRQERIQTALDVPVSDSEICDWTQDVARSAEPAFEALIEAAAQGYCLYNDDTTARILELIKENKTRKDDERKGMFTSAILSQTEGGQEIALFFTGRQHAGENLNDVLDHREDARGPPVQMCDAASRNVPSDHDTRLSNCLAHLRRKFFEILDFWPELILPIIIGLNDVFRNERKAKKRDLSRADRLAWHQEHSGPLMDQILKACNEMLEKRQAEPNSSLGKAIAYLKNHWDEFTLFLREEDVPLSNNACERTIKRAVLNRKNAYFFKTVNGAKAGDILLSLIETCYSNQVNPYKYLVAIQEYKADVEKHPELWLPWCYEDRCVSLTDKETCRADAASF